VKTALGKGLEALLPAGKGGQEVVELDIARVAAGREQPRKVFRDEALKELADSIREKGVLQPIIVAREDGGSFRLIAGERRLRASRLAGLKKVPAIVREASPEDSLEIALIENIQREDLGPVETAQAFDRLMKDFGLTQEKLAEKVGKDRATVANYLRLLRLPDEVKKLLNDGRLTMGHARALLAMEGAARQTEAARKILARGLSVREAEALSRQKPKSPSAAKRRDPQIASLEDKLKRSLGTRVAIRHSGKRGRIEIEYYSLEELDRLLDILIR